MGDSGNRKHTRKKQSLILVVSILAVTLLLLVGTAFFAVAISGTTGSTVGTLRSGRKITTFSNSYYVKSRMKKDTAFIETGGKQIIIKPDSVWIDNQLVQEIDPGSKHVKVRYYFGNIEVECEK